MFRLGDSIHCACSGRIGNQCVMGEVKMVYVVHQCYMVERDLQIDFKFSAPLLKLTKSSDLVRALQVRGNRQ